jgi:hypothetical protein
MSEMRDAPRPFAHVALNQVFGLNYERIRGRRQLAEFKKTSGKRFLLPPGDNRHHRKSDT